MLNGHALLCVCAASAILGIFGEPGEPGDPRRGSIVGIRDTASWPAGCLPG